MSTTRQRIEELFEAALEQPSAGRVDWVNQACAHEPDVAATVLDLLRAHEHAAGILEESLPRRSAEQKPAEDIRYIGPYRVIRELGRGGMGVVYLAVREEESFKRRVALKLLRGSPDADELYQRFRAERHILASLNHSNISQLLDGGITDGRLPYLVMEYVEGVSITEYCDRHRLSLARRLRLFTSVCAAVQHAHKNLVLHRDLKPGNILVNDEGEVKLLDFGIAKLLNPVLSAIDQPITRTEHRVLTPQYASPEQVRGEPLSTASDVYSLGVVLYELLSGFLPYTFSTRSPAELHELICEREPLRPSAIVRTEQAADSAALLRGSTTARLSRDLRGDLDAIVAMALRKEADRRYGSAEVLAEEIERFLDGKPVAAQRGSTSYRLGKMLRRHRGEVIAVSLVVLSLVAGASTALWQASVARQERDRTQAALVEAQQALQQAREISAFMTGLFEASDPGDAQGGEATARDLLRRGIRRADQLNDQPIVQASMFDAIARVQRALGQYTDARVLLERALAIRERQRGMSHPELAETLLGISDLLRIEGLYPEALARAERALSIQERAYGPVHAEVARTLLQVSQLQIYLSNKAAIDLAQRAVAAQQSTLPPGDTARFQGLMRLGNAMRRFGYYDDAEQTFRSSLQETGAETLNAAEAMIQIGILLQERAVRLPEAEDLARRALQVRRRLHGPEHPATIGAQAELARVISTAGRHDEAVAMTREHVRMSERAIGPEHPNMTFAYGTLNAVLIAAGRFAEAEVAARQSLAIATRTFGPDHMVAGGSHLGLGEALMNLGRLPEAEREIRLALAIRERAVGVRSALAGYTKDNLARVLMRQRKYEEAEAQLLAGIALEEQIGVSPQHPDYARLLRTAVELYEAMRRPADAGRYRARLAEATK